MADDLGQLDEDLEGASSGEDMDDEASGVAGDPGSSLDRSEWTSWSNLWQVPAIALSVVLISLGLYVASSRRPANDFDGVLDHVDHLIATAAFDTARQELQATIEPFLSEATPQQTARYHATVADWIFASQAARGVSVTGNNQLIDREYGLTEGAIVLSPARLERWTETLIELGRLDDARARLAEIEAMSVTDAAGLDARLRRNRLLRRLVEVSLRKEELSYDATMAILDHYRDDPLLESADVAWVVARQAELRLEAGDAGPAVERLFVEMRRLEQSEEVADPNIWAELYTLLGRGYYHQGRSEQAAYYLDEAMKRAEPARAERGPALLYLGYIDMAAGEVDRAFQRFDEVTRAFPGEYVFLPALLARAEAASIAGRHRESLEDYRRLVERLPDAGERRDVTPRVVAASLADRHDAALTIGNLPLALDYVALAEALFEAGAVPTDVLRRIASTSRQIADDLMAEAVALMPDGPVRLEDVDPQLRLEAAGHYEQAGAYFLRHARAVAAVPDAEELWADSLWLAGDSLDLAGDRADAIGLFIEYIAGRPLDDPRRAEITYRLGQAQEAEEQYEAAAGSYARVIEEHPRGPFGTGSHVPLARCLVALDRGRDAARTLARVVDGREGPDAPITPDATDYRDALVALGKIHYDAGETKEAIERLTVAAERYPDDPRINEVRFRLADSHRRFAHAIREELRTEGGLSPQERNGREQAAANHLATARRLFARVGDGYAALDERRLDRLQRDYRRNAALYRADCVFDLGEYAEAARLYDHASRQFSDHHASMHALVQIVNCFDRLGVQRDADIAHQNALTRLRQLPDSTFDDPQALMDRAAWERWLRNRPVGLAQATGEGPGTTP